ncbi:hypothetical protein D3C81_980140 [compost metagenome]
MCGLELEHHRVPYPLGAPGRAPGFLRQLRDHFIERTQRHIFGERVFRGDRLHRLVRFHRPLVDAACTPIQTAAEAAEQGFQLFQRQLTQVTDGGDVQRRQLAGHHLAHARDAIDRQGRQELFDTRRRHHELAIGLAPVGGHLGQELVRGDAGRGGEPGDFTDLRADGAGNLGGDATTGRRRGHVQVGLVQ